MASTRQTFHIEGLKELDLALAELPKATARNVLRRNLKKIGQPIADAESSLAPIGVTGQLAESPTVGTKLTRRQKRANPKESMVEVYVGPTAHPKSVQTEFGNAHQAAQPHLRPAWDANVGSSGGIALKTFTDDTKADIEKARKRLAAKAERLAAKMKS